MNILTENEQRSINESYISFYGSFAQQNPQAFVSINRLLNTYNFTTIIEFGTHTGGLSVLLSVYTYLSKIPNVNFRGDGSAIFPNASYHRQGKAFYTFDNVERDMGVIALIKQLGGIFLRADTLNDKSAIEAIRALINNSGSGRVLLLCDGGCKKKELELYGGSLKPGDFIMLHDWAYDEKAREENIKNGVWVPWECSWESEAEGYEHGIKDICENHKIVQLHSDEFDKVAWFCGVKQ